MKYKNKLIYLVLLIFEILLNCAIINRVKYTEIDWSTYMQQVECFLKGELNYEKIYGDTGPIVYPSGHLYIYTVLYYLTNYGKELLNAQYIFAVLYLLNLIAVFRIYHKVKKVPRYVLIIMCATSYRIHSIYALRLFNDPFAMFLLYISVNLLLDNHWTLACLVYSAALSIKMNILLFAPGLLLTLLESCGLQWTLVSLTLAGLLQILISLPFLLTHPLSYIKRAFNFGRVFEYKWTVNWRFIPESLFLNHYFHLVLLVLHLLVLLLFFGKRYLNLVKSVRRKKSKAQSSSKEKILFTLFTSNLIGIAFSRSLHYQFYVWYFHSLSLLIWLTSFESITKLCILGVIELCWNTYPSTIWSSLTLNLMHLLILGGLWDYKHKSRLESK